MRDNLKVKDSMEKESAITKAFLIQIVTFREKWLIVILLGTVNALLMMAQCILATGKTSKDKDSELTSNSSLERLLSINKKMS